MTSISHLANSYTKLRHRLHLHLGTSPAEVSVLLPTKINDELSFYRLVIWGYVVFQETAKVPIGFLKELPPLSMSDQVLPHLSILRTWIGHNLDLSKSGDEKKLRAAQHWLRQASGSSSPSTAEQWEKCCNFLISQIAEIIDGSVAACDALDSPTDGPRLLILLKERLSKTWEAYRYDAYVASAIDKLGYQGLSSIDIRKKYLESWRKVIALSDPKDWDRLLNQRIETDLLELMNNALPLSAQEVLELLACKSKDELAVIMLLLRQVIQKDKKKVSEVLQWLSEKNYLELSKQTE